MMAAEADPKDDQPQPLADEDMEVIRYEPAGDHVQRIPPGKDPPQGE